MRRGPIGHNSAADSKPCYARCYVLVERPARLELDGYGFVVWHAVLEAFASGTR